MPHFHFQNSQDLLAYDSQLLACCCHHGWSDSKSETLWLVVHWVERWNCILLKRLLLLYLVSGRVVQLHLPLSGSGVVQFLFCLHWSSLRPCTRSGLESCSALLLIALCSNLLTRPWDRLMKSGLKRSNASWGGEGNIYSKLLVGGTATVQYVDTNPVEREKIFIGLESVLKISLIYSLTLENPLHSLVKARRCRQHGNIMLSFSEDKGKRALLTGGIWILQKASQTSLDLYHSQGWDKTCYINWVERKTEMKLKRRKKGRNCVTIKDFFNPLFGRGCDKHRLKQKMSPSVKSPLKRCRCCCNNVYSKSKHIKILCVGSFNWICLIIPQVLKGPYRTCATLFRIWS